jgi:formylmethanofuran dehydrogenase subunit E
MRWGVTGLFIKPSAFNNVAIRAVLNDNELMALYRRERKMIINMALKRIADFHGHVCPDLVLGSKLCEYIQKLLPSNKFANGIAAIISENCTSALDAIQILLGATLGNQRLKVMDFGKHNYTVIPKSASSGFRLILNIQTFEDENEYQHLSCKMLEKTILMDEVVQLQTLLDERVKYLLKQPPESLFRIEWTKKGQPLSEEPSVYLTCCRCGEQVLHSHAVYYKSETYCGRCFQLLKTGNPSHCLQ